MSDEDLEVLITLDDPWYGPDDDIFHEHHEVALSQKFEIIL
jgi:hypothetical protein